jgi:glycosyltransferase involved in cell wall biosynthesis
VPARPFWTFPGSPWTKLGFYFNLLALLPNRNWKDYLKEQQPALLHVNDKSCLQAGVAARKLGLPVVWHLRSSYAPTWSRLQAKISARIIRKNANAMIAISEDETDGFDSCRNLRVIYNSLDFTAVDKAIPQRESIRTELGIGTGDVVVGLVVTQLNSVRGAWDFLNMAGYAARMSQLSWKFAIIGSTTVESAAQARILAQQHGISERLILTGFRSDALAVIAALDVLVVCNHHGVLGRPPLEAMAVGTPVAAWHGHSRRSSVARDGETALLVKRRDIESLAQAVTCLADDSALRKSLGGRGMQYAREHFASQRNARLVEQVYENVLGLAQ